MLNHLETNKAVQNEKQHEESFAKRNSISLNLR